MAILFDYQLAVWLRLEMPDATPASVEELTEYLQREYGVVKLKVIEESAPDKGELTFSLGLQLTFDESQMEGVEPTEQALGTINEELRAYLGAQYEVTYLELLDDSPTSYLIAEWEEPVEEE